MIRVAMSSTLHCGMVPLRTATVRLAPQYDVPVYDGQQCTRSYVHGQSLRHSEGCFQTLALEHIGEEKRTRVESDITRHRHIETSKSITNTRVVSTPVTHHEALEAKLSFEKVIYG